MLKFTPPTRRRRTANEAARHTETYAFGRGRLAGVRATEANSPCLRHLQPLEPVCGPARRALPGTFSYETRRRSYFAPELADRLPAGPRGRHGRPSAAVDGRETAGCTALRGTMHGRQCMRRAFLTAWSTRERRVPGPNVVPPTNAVPTPDGRRGQDGEHHGTLSATS